MSDDVLNRIEKHMEGNTLALSAVAEVLQKMDGRFVDEENAAIAKQQEDEAYDERTAMVKAIASEVYGMIKADNGMDVDGTKVRSGTKMKGRGEDAESPVTPTTKIADQQATIQAADMDDEEEEEEVKKEGDQEHPMEEDEKDEDAKKGMYKGEDPDEEEDDKDPVKAMAKELDALKKQIANTEAGMQKAIQDESEQRLRKMGFREELGLQAPQMITPLGVDGSTPIVKSDAVDTVDQLANLSWKELRGLQTKIEMGETEGVPRELLGN